MVMCRLSMSWLVSHSMGTVARTCCKIWGSCVSLKVNTPSISSYFLSKGTAGDDDADTHTVTLFRFLTGGHCHASSGVSRRRSFNFRQDATSKTLVAAVNPRLLLLAHQIILGQKLLCHGNIHVFPRKNLVNSALYGAYRKRDRASLQPELRSRHPA